MSDLVICGDCRVVKIVMVFFMMIFDILRKSCSLSCIMEGVVGCLF